MEETGITIIGSGVIGLAIAAQLSSETNDVVVLDRNGDFGQETSSRNSEVLHCGVYYPTGSLKAKLCVEGVDKLYRFCERGKIPFRKTGKEVSGNNWTKLPKWYIMRVWMSSL